MTNKILQYVKTDSVFEDACNIIETAQKVAYSAVDLTLVHRNWLLGKRIADEELILQVDADGSGQYKDDRYGINLQVDANGTGKYSGR